MTVVMRNTGRAPVIVGGGIAGLLTALRLVPLPVVVLTKAQLETEASSAWAQGGIAAAIGPGDNPELHLADTLAAGDGLCEVDVARRITAAGPDAIELLLRYGVRFYRDHVGALRLGLEAAHKRHRIVHAAGDGTGREIMRALAAAVRETPSVAAIKRAREQGALIVYAPISFTPDYHELSRAPYGILKGVVESKAFRKGSWGAEIVDVLAPEEPDIVIEGKRGLDAFASTNLDFILRARGIDRIALGGFLTNCCVESTMRTGYEKGFDVVTLTDCTATVSEDEQRFAVEKNFPMFSRPMTHEAFLAELAGGPAAAGRSHAYTR